MSEFFKSYKKPPSPYVISSFVATWHYLEASIKKKGLSNEKKSVINKHWGHPKMMSESFKSYWNPSPYVIDSFVTT